MRPLGEHVRWLIQRLRGRLTTTLLFVLEIQILDLVLLGPLAAWALHLLLRRWGRASIGNFEIASFFLSVPGLAALVILGSLALATSYLRIAGLMVILAEPQPRAWRTAGKMLLLFPRLAALGLWQFFVYLVLALPFAGLTLIVYRTLWAGYDLNGLVILRPPVFWWGVGLAAVLVAIYAMIAGRIFLRWSFSLPALLFERERRASTAMRLSADLVRGRTWPLFASVAGWFLIMLAASSVLLGLLQLASDRILDHIGLAMESVLPATALIVLAHAGALFVVSTIAAITLSGLLLDLYRRATGNGFLDTTLATELSPPRSLTSRIQHRWLWIGIPSLVFALATATAYRLVTEIRLNDPMEVTAHRAGAALGPENTVAALRRSIEAGAEWAEIDVQRTKDEKLVVLHDTDVARIGGANRQVREMTFAEIRQIDLGRAFGPTFAGERVPSLEEIISAAGNKIRLNIELKPHGPSDVEPLVERVIDEIRRAGVVRRCRVCSQSYDGLQRVKQLEPDLTVGFIAGRAIGDLSELDVDFLMVSGSLATSDLVSRAAARGIAVHAWTINDPDQLPPLVDRGVANVITDQPGLLRRRLQEIRRLAPGERILLRVRNLIAD